MRKLMLASLAALATLAAHPVAANPTYARNLAANCANCHGTDGNSKGGMPVLAGKPKAEIIGKMKEFKEGKQPATIMHQLAKGYTDEQIELIAGYLAAQKPSH